MVFTTAPGFLAAAAVLVPAPRKRPMRRCQCCRLVWILAGIIQCRLSVGWIALRINNSQLHMTRSKHWPAGHLLPANATGIPLLLAQRRDDEPFLANDVLSLKEREVKELEWLVHATENILYPRSGSKPGARLGEQKPLSRSQFRRVHNLMKAWGTRRTEGAPRIVDKLFDYLYENAVQNVTTYSFNLRLEAWAAAKDSQSVAQCTQILTTLKEHEVLQPNVHSYNACIKAWIRSSRYDRLDRVEHYIEEMQDLASQTGDSMLVPNRRSFNLLLHGLSRSNETSAAAARAIEVFKHLRSIPEPFCRPNGNTFHQFICCLVRDSRVEGYEERLDRALSSCLDLSAEQDTEVYADTFNVYMGGWLKSKLPIGLEKIEAALRTMERMCAEGHSACQPNCVTMNTVLAACVKFYQPDSLERALSTRKRLEPTYSLTPDTVTFNTLIDAHAKSGRAAADIAALSLLQTMERSLIKNKNRARPDSYTYCGVINCLAKTNVRSAGTQSLQILQRMLKLHTAHGGEKPNLAVYNSVLNALAVSNPANLTAVKALLSEMEDSVEGSLAPRPNTISYNSAFKAALLSRSVHGAQWADELLQSLESKAKEGGPLVPDSFSYTTVIAAYAKSACQGKVAKATEIVHRAIFMHRSGCMRDPPSVSVFNAALNACCFSGEHVEEKLDAFFKMIEIREMITTYAQPDETTYGTLLRGCSQLLSQGHMERDTYLRQVFHEACNAGFCGNFVLEQMKFAASSETFGELLGSNTDTPLRASDLPPPWSRNVKLQA
jgi:hypothetical protein